jgi:uracil-DNA glycosylase family 4
MLVAHNFDSDRGFALSLTRQGEAGGEFWQRLLRLLAGAELSPEECFFTNVLMGLKPRKAEGEMPSAPGYKDQCVQFLKQQVKIVKPRAVIAQGAKAEKYVHGLHRSSLAVRHPKDWYFRELVTRNERLLAEGKMVGRFILQVSAWSSPVDQWPEFAL